MDMGKLKEVLETKNKYIIKLEADLKRLREDQYGFYRSIVTVVGATDKELQEFKKLWENEERTVFTNREVKTYSIHYYKNTSITNK